MNWLAHIFLSEYNINFQIANYLADPLKGRMWENANEDIIKGMKTHKLIDSYTDSNEHFKNSKARLGQKGLLKAIIIDLTYDYLLTKNWDVFCTVSIDFFLNDFYNQASNQMKFLPSHASTSLKRLIQHDVLNKYKSIEDLQVAFQKVDNRLSKRLYQRDQAVKYYDRVCLNIEDIEMDFLLFFPQICKKVRENIDSEKLNHWKI